VRGQVELDHAAECVAHDHRVGFGLGEGRMRRQHELGGGHGVLAVSDGGSAEGVQCWSHFAGLLGCSVRRCSYLPHRAMEKRQRG